MLKYFYFILFFFFIVFGVNAATLTNAGFASDSILVTNSSPDLGESIKLSIPLYNESGGIINGSVILYEKDKKIEEKIIILKNGEFSGVSFTWKATPGIHNFVFKFEDTTIQLPKKTKEMIILENRESKINVYTQGGIQNPEVVEKDNSLFKQYVVDNENQATIETTGIDGYRQDFLTEAEIKLQSIRKDINQSISQNKEYEQRLSELRDALPRADGSLMTPVQYIYAWMLGAVAYILSNMYLFYGIIAFFIFIILRFIIRRFRRNHH